VLLQLSKYADLVQDDPRLMGALLLIALIVGAAQYTLGPKAEWVESVRKRYWLKLNEVLTLVGGYASGQQSHKDFVLTTPASEETIERAVYRAGYHRNIIAAFLHVHVNGKKLTSSGSWVYRERIFADKQHHLRIYEDPTTGKKLLYHHYETSWVSHPIKHYFNVDMTHGDPQGKLRQALDSAGVEYSDLHPVDGD